MPMRCLQEEIDIEVDTLKRLKLTYKEETGKEFQAPGGGGRSKPQKEKKAVPEKKEEKKPDGKKQTKLGIDVSKDENYSEWYSQVTASMYTVNLVFRLL